MRTAKRDWIRVGDRVRLKLRGTYPPKGIYGADEGVVVHQFFGVDIFRIRLMNGRETDAWHGNELKLLEEGLK